MQSTLCQRCAKVDVKWEKSNQRFDEVNAEGEERGKGENAVVHNDVEDVVLVLLQSLLEPGLPLLRGGGIAGAAFLGKGNLAESSSGTPAHVSGLSSWTKSMSL